jgi:glycosyltransferase involved in cell wall biosynthesis
MDDAQQAQLDAVLTSESVDLASYLPSEITGSVRRVAIFTEAFLPKVDGVSRTALLTIKYLQSTGRELIVFAPAPAIPHIGPTHVYAIPSLWAPDVPETRIAPPWPFLLPRLRHFAPDLIHLFSPASLGAIGMLAGSWLRTPVIATYQTDLPGYAGSYGYGSLRGMFIDVMRYIHNGCHLTLAPSKSTLAELAGWASGGCGSGNAESIRHASIRGAAARHGENGFLRAGARIGCWCSTWAVWPVRNTWRRYDSSRRTPVWR